MGKAAGEGAKTQKWGSDDERSESTRVSDDISPSASSAELGAKVKTNRFTKEELAARGRWADVESDGEDRNRKDNDGWTSGKKKSGKAASKGSAQEAKAPVKQPEAYRAPKQQPKPEKVESGWGASSWSEESWGGSWSKKSGKGGGGWWEESSWDKPSKGKGKGGGKKEKNEHFKWGPTVGVAMDRSRLAW